MTTFKEKSLEQRIEDNVYCSTCDLDLEKCKCEKSKQCRVILWPQLNLILTDLKAEEDGEVIANPSSDYSLGYQAAKKNFRRKLGK